MGRLAIDMAAPRAAPTVVDVARSHQAADRLWLTYWNINALAVWRRRWSDVRLVFPTAVLPWRRNHSLLDRLAAAGVDALNLHHRQVSPRIAEATHRRGLLLLAWGLRGDATRVARVLGAGADGGSFGVTLKRPCRPAFRRAAFAASVTSTLAWESVIRWRMPSSP